MPEWQVLGQAAIRKDVSAACCIALVVVLLQVYESAQSACGGRGVKRKNFLPLLCRMVFGSEGKAGFNVVTILLKEKTLYE